MGARKFDISVSLSPGYRAGDEKEAQDIQNDFAFVKVRQDLVQLFSLRADQLPKLPTTEKQLIDILTAASGNTIAYGYGDYSRNRTGVKKELRLLASFVQDYSVITTKSQERNIGICHGDSGGGLFTTFNNGVTYLLGVVSGITNDNCGAVGADASYATIHQHLCWVQKSSRYDLGIANCR